jgi:hypothetical protein
MNDQTELDRALDELHHDVRSTDAPLHRVRATVMAAAAGTPVPAVRRRFRPAIVAAAAVAAVAAVVAGAVVVTQGPNDAAPSAPTAGGSTRQGADQDVTLLSARQVLNDAADLTVNAVDRPIAPGQYLHITERGTHTRSYVTLPAADRPQSAASGYTQLVESRRDVWIPQDYTQEWLERRALVGEPVWLGGTMPQDQAPPMRPVDTDEGEWRGLCGDFFPKSKPAKVCGAQDDWDSPAFYQGLPRDGAQLHQWLVDTTAHRGSTPAGMFHYAVQVLRTGLMPADLRAHWYRALALIDGVRVVGEVTMPDGRTGLALGLDEPREQRQLVLDPTNGDFIGERMVAGEQPDYAWIAPGTVTSLVTITTTVVDAQGEGA